MVWPVARRSCATGFARGVWQAWQEALDVVLFDEQTLPLGGGQILRIWMFRVWIR